MRVSRYRRLSGDDPIEQPSPALPPARWTRRRKRDATGIGTRERGPQRRSSHSRAQTQRRSASCLASGALPTSEITLWLTDSRAIYLLLGTVPSRQRGRASGLFSGGFLLGGISGPAVGGLVAAWSLRAPFFIYGGLLVVPAILSAVVLRRVPDRRRAARHASALWLATLIRAVRSSTWRAAASANLADGFAASGRARRPGAAVRPGDPAPVSGLDRDRVPPVRRAERRRAAARRAGGRHPRPGAPSCSTAGCVVSAVGMVMLAPSSGPWAFLAAMAVAGFSAPACWTWPRPR